MPESSRSQRVVRPLITPRIPFQLQPLPPPPPTITLRKNFRGVVKAISDPSRRSPFTAVPIPIVSTSAGGDAAPAAQRTRCSKMVEADQDSTEEDADMGADMDGESEFELSSVKSEFHPFGGSEDTGPLTFTIPKPAGEAGWLQSGGYNLEKTLGWPKEEFDEIQVSHTIFIEFD